MNKSAFHLQQMINKQLNQRKGSIKGGPNISVSKPIEPHRNTTQTDGSLERAEGIMQQMTPQAFLVDKESPMQEGQIHHFNRLAH